MLSLEYLRSFKLFNIALFDLITAFVGIYLLAPLLTRLFRIFRLEIPTITWLLWTLPLGVVAHLIFAQHTPLTQSLLEPNSHYLVKLFIVTLVILGLTKIKKI